MAGRLKQAFRFAATAAAVAVTTAGACFAQSAPHGDIVALVVGASGYRVPGLNPLDGPRNDVTLVVNTLLDEGVPRGNIRVLADSLDRSAYERKVKADGAPAKAGILAGFDWLAHQPDFGHKQILIYLSGHGLQVPEQVASNELDGLDEAFVPIDAGPAPAGSNAPANLLIDDEIERAVTDIRKAGATVWLVVDSCNSGTISRAGIDGAPRKANSEALGVSSASIARAREAAANRAHPDPESSDIVSPKGPGHFIGFYAAMPDQVAYETALPRYAPAGQQVELGVLTWNFAQAIRQKQAASYGALSMRIAAGYADWGGGRTSPLFEGDLMQPPMLGGGGDRTYAVRAQEGKLHVRAGLIDGLAPGARVALLDPLGNGKPLARATIAAVGVAEADLTAVEVASDPKGLIRSALSSTPAPANSAPPAASARGFDVHGQTASESGLVPIAASVVSKPVSFALTVTEPALLDPASSTSEDKALLASVRAALARPEKQLELSLVEPERASDVRPVVANGRLWLFRAGAAPVLDSKHQPQSLNAADIDKGLLSADLRAMARGQNIVRVLNAVSSDTISSGLHAELFVKRGSTATGAACTAPDYADTVPSDARPIGAGVVPAIGHCDTVFIRLTNQGSDALSVTPLFVSAWANTEFLGGYREEVVSGLPLRSDETRIISFVEDLSSHSSFTPAGRSQIALIAVPAADNSYPSYSYLAESEIPSIRGGGGFGDTLRQAAYAGAGLRSGAASADDRGGGIALTISIMDH